MTDKSPHKVVETLHYACTAVKAAKDRLRHCEKQIEKEQQEATSSSKLAHLLSKKETLTQELDEAYEVRKEARDELNELFASLRG